MCETCYSYLILEFETGLFEFQLEFEIGLCIHMYLTKNLFICLDRNSIIFSFF